MKNSTLKKIIFCCFLSCIIVSGAFYFLYKTERIIVNFDFAVSEKKSVMYEQKEIIGLFIKSNKEISIPLKITSEMFDKKVPNVFLYNGLFQFFNSINLYADDTFILSLHHVVVVNKKVIINLHIDKKDQLTVFQEIDLIKSLYLTTKQILPYINEIYLFDEDKELSLDHVIPWCNEEMFGKKRINQDSIDSGFNYQIIPLLVQNGSKIGLIFEKNIFQDMSVFVSFLKNQLYSLSWIKELGNFCSDSPNQFFYFMNFAYSVKPSIRFVFYSFFSDIDLVISIDEWPQCKKNNAIISEINRIEKRCRDCNYDFLAENFPLKSILSCPYPSVYVLISGPNKEEIIKIVNLLFKEK